MHCVSTLGLTLTVCAITFATLLVPVAADPPATDSPSADWANSKPPSLNEIIGQRCLKCHHHDADAETDVDLTGVTLESLERNLDLARTLIDVIDTRAMPPDPETALSARERSTLLASLRKTYAEAAVSGAHQVRTPIRRLNRVQYNNSVIDLFELNCVVFTLPEKVMRIHGNSFDPERGVMPDTVKVGNRPLGKSQMIEQRLAGVAAFPQDLQAEHGYNNRADHLSMSPLLMEEFLKLGTSITQSPDFNRKQVGIWKSFFAVPSHEFEAKEEIRQRLRWFLSRAFRRPPTDKVMERYTQYASAKFETTGDFTGAMKSAAAATLTSPRFLYLYDVPSDPHVIGEARVIDDFELATRLSFFLWGSLPDDKLLALAQRGKLSTADVLHQQVDRMLRDQKIKRFCDSFPRQWLQLDRLVSSLPNRTKYPDFYYSKYRASMHMMLEPLLLFETVLIEDRAISELIAPDFSYRSARLENLYGSMGDPAPRRGAGDVAALTFRRLPLKDRRSGGVITNAAVMTMTSGPERTKPITRGAWVAAVIFNDPPDPPPADVPTLPEPAKDGPQSLTVRERLAAHRKQADCRGCHEQLDPLGFALENYDAVGRWRDRYENDLPIDSSGTLFREHRFSTPVEFKELILADPARFCRAFAAHLLSYALARELGPADEIALDRITAQVAADGYKMKSLLRAIVSSSPFRTKS